MTENLSSPDLVKMHLKQETTQGLKECYALHGTSILALEYALKNQVLPGWTKPATDNGFYTINPGDFFVWPIKSFSKSEAFFAASCYSVKIAQTHALAQLLGKDFTNPEHYQYIREVLSENGPKPKSMDIIIAREIALQYKGIVIGIKPVVEQKYVIEDLVGIDDGFRIKTKSGLPFDLISGVYPMSQLDNKGLQAILK